MYAIQPNMKLIVAPSATAVSVSEAKNHLRVDESADDALIEMMIKVATQKIEECIDMKLVTQTWEIYYDRFPYSSKDVWWDGVQEMPITEVDSVGRTIVLPIGRLQSATLKTYDDANNEYTMPASDYVLDLVGNRGRLSLVQGAVWPSTILRANNGIKITAVVGFGPPASVPSDLKIALLQLTAFLYENRGDASAQLPHHIYSMIKGYERIKVGC